MRRAKIGAVREASCSGRALQYFSSVAIVENFVIPKDCVKTFLQEVFKHVKGVSQNCFGNCPIEVFCLQGGYHANI